MVWSMTEDICTKFCILLQEFNGRYAMKAYYKIISFLIFINMEKKLKYGVYQELVLLIWPTVFPLIFVNKTLHSHIRLLVNHKSAFNSMIKT